MFKKATTQQILNTKLNVDENDTATPVVKNVYLDPSNHESFPKDSNEINRKTLFLNYNNL